MDDKISVKLTVKEAGIVYEALLSANWPGRLISDGADLIKTFAPYAPFAQKPGPPTEVK